MGEGDGVEEVRESIEKAPEGVKSAAWKVDSSSRL